MNNPEFSRTKYSLPAISYLILIPLITQSLVQSPPVPHDVLFSLFRLTNVQPVSRDTRLSLRRESRDSKDVQYPFPCSLLNTYCPHLLCSNR